MYDDDDHSWHPDDERPSKKRKSCSSNKKICRQRAKPRDLSAECSDKASTDEAKVSKHGSSDRPHGRERTRKMAKTEPLGCPPNTLPAPEAVTGYGEVAQQYYVDIKGDPHTHVHPSPSSTARNAPTRSQKCQRSGPHLEHKDPEKLMDYLAKQYVESIDPDLSTVVGAKDRDPSLPSFRRQYLVGEDESIRKPRAPGRRCGSTRHMGRPDDTCIVTEHLPGRLAKLLPPGTKVRRPPGKLVQLVAQVIHESPCKALRVQQVYTGLKNRFPYFRFMTKKEVTTWKSSIRHALFQKWFKKVVVKNETLASDKKGGSHAKSNFWRINYKNRPREWDMPDAPEGEDNMDENLKEALAAHKNICESPKSDEATSQEPTTGLGATSTGTPSVWSQHLESTLGLLPPSSRHLQACKVLQSTEAAVPPVKYGAKNHQQQQYHRSQSQEIKLHQVFQKQEEQQQQAHAFERTPILTSPLSLTAQSWGTDPVRSPACNLPSPQGWSDSLEEIAAIIKRETLGAQAPESRPSSRLSSFSQPLSAYSGISSILGSPRRRTIHTEQQLQPLGDQGARMEPFAAPPSASQYLPTKQESYPPRDYTVSTGANLSMHGSPWNTDEISAALDATLWNEHLYVKKHSEADARSDMGGTLASPPFPCSMQMTQDALAPKQYVSGGFALPQTQQAPGYKLRPQREPFSSPERRQQEHESMMPSSSFTSRPSPRCSRDCTLTKGERPQAPLRSLFPQTYTLPQGQTSSAGHNFVLRGRWVPGPPSWPRSGGPTSGHDQREFPAASRYRRPTYSAIANPVNVIRMKDGTVYILSWPTAVDDDSVVEHARCRWE